MAKRNITGLAWRGGGLEWTTLAAGKSGWQAEATRRESVAEPASDAATANPEAVRSLRGRVRLAGGPVHFAIRCDRVLVRVAELPTGDPAELRGMVDLQVDKFSPFAADESVVAFEVLHAGPTATRVLIAVLERAGLERWTGPLRAAGMDIFRVDLELLGWWRLLDHAGWPAREEGHVFLILEDGLCSTIITRRGELAHMNTFAAPALGTDAAAAGEMAADLDHALTSLEAAGVCSRDARVTVFYEDAVPAALLTALKTCGLADAEDRALDQLPPLSEGVVWRAAEKGGQALDLALPEWTLQRKSRQLHRRMALAGGALLIAWLLAVLGMVIGFGVEKQRLANARIRLEELRGPADEVKRLRAKIESIRQYGDQKHSALEYLREVSAHMPEGLYLTVFNYRKGEELDLRGEAPNQASTRVFDFFESLQKSVLFRKFKDQNVNTVNRQGQPVVEFRVTILLPGSEGAP